MKKQVYLVALFAALGVIAGCGDSPKVMLRDSLSTWNELADVLGQIPNDESAEEVAGQVFKNKVEPLKKKWEKNVKERTKEFSKFDRDKKKDLEEAAKYY